MPTRMLLAILIGTVLAFSWGAVSWTSGMYGSAIRPMPGGADVAARIAGAVDEDGAYYHPSPPDTSGMTEQQSTIAMDAFLAEHRKGPLVMAIVRREGVDPMSPTILARGFAIELFATSMLAAIVAVAAKFGARLRERLAVVFLATGFAMLGSHGVLWNFFHLPDAYSIALFVDGTVTWLLAGLPCAILIRAQRN